MLLFQLIILHSVASQDDYEADYSDVVDSKSDKCPTGATGTHPNCKCTKKIFDYSIDLNECFRVCPENSTGYWPNCVCDNEITIFDKEYFECRNCPAGSKKSSIYPNCDCSQVGTYNLYRNQCNRCIGAEGIFPNCVCSDAKAKYNTKNNICEYCPEDSTGVIPNCKCNGRTG